MEGRDDAPSGSARPPGWRVLSVAGPDVGAVAEVADGTLVVGRGATADLTIRDPAVELHQLLVGSEPAGGLRITQISGRTVARLGAQPIGPSGVSVTAAAVLFLGSTRLHIGPVDGWHELNWHPTAPSTDAVTGVARRWAWCRRRDTDHEPDPMLVELAAPSGPTADDPTPAVADIVLRVRTGSEVVPRQRDDGSMFRVRLGLVDAVTDAGGPGPDARPTIDLEAGQILQLVGPGAAGVARSIVIQLATQVSPDRLAISLAGATGWLPDGVRLPHLAPPDAAQQHLVIVADGGFAAADEHQLRTQLGIDRDTAVVLLDDRRSDVDRGLPGGRLVLGALGRARWSVSDQPVASASIHVARVEPATVVEVSGAIAPRPVDQGPGEGDDLPTLLEELISADRSVDATRVVRWWRRRGGTVAINLGRGTGGVTWRSLAAAPVLVVGDDDEERRRILTALACGLLMEYGPDDLRLVPGAGLPMPAADHVSASPLPPARLAHELVRPRPRDGRTTVVIADDTAGEVASVVDPDPELLPPGSHGASGGPTVRLVLGVRPDHPWVRPPRSACSTLVVSTIGDRRKARDLLGDARASRLTPGQILVRWEDHVARFFRLPVIGDAELARVTALLGHAESLVAGRGSPRRDAAVRTCEPCPDDDSPSAPHSSDPSSATTPATVSSPA